MTASATPSICTGTCSPATEQIGHQQNQENDQDCSDHRADCALAGWQLIQLSRNIAHLCIGQRPDPRRRLVRIDAERDDLLAHLGPLEKRQDAGPIPRPVGPCEHLLGADQSRVGHAERHRDNEHHHREHERHAPAQLPKTFHVELPLSAERSRIPNASNARVA
jgi:hypothetical protein